FQEGVSVKLRLPQTADEIRERMSGNICRCGAYANILAAIEDAAGEIKS
ncbi:aldehyde oxidoreductase, partial [Escherichia coli]